MLNLFSRIKLMGILSFMTLRALFTETYSVLKIMDKMDTVRITHRIKIYVDLNGKTKVKFVKPIDALKEEFSS